VYYTSNNIDEADIKKIQNTNLENETICNLNKSIFQDINIAIVFYNTEEKILHVNPYFCHKFGFQADEVIEKPISSVISFKNKDKSFFSTALQGTKTEKITEIFGKNKQKIVSCLNCGPLYINDNISGGYLTILDITCYKRLEEDAKERGYRLQVLIDKSRIGIVIINQEHRIIETNKRFAEMLGYSMEEMYKLYTWDWEANMTEKQIRENFKDLSKIDKAFETQHIRKDGSLYDAEISATGTYVNGFKAIICICQDITERKKTEKALRESENKFRVLVDQTPEALFLHDLDGNIIEINRASVELYGYNREEFSKLKVKDIDPDSVKRGDNKYFWNRLKGNRVIKFETKHQKKDGTVFPLNITISAIRLEDKKYILAIAQDISEKRKVEEILQQNEEFQKAMIACSPLAIYSIDISGNVLTWNKSAEKMFGWTAQEVLGKELPMIPKSKNHEFLALRHKVLTEKGFVGKELIRQRKDGTLFPMSLSVAPIHDKDGRIAGIISAAEDITNRKQYQERLEKAMNATIEALSKVVDTRDPYTSGHQYQVSKLSTKIAKELKLPGDKIEGIRIASLIHDIGKIGIPSEILTKPSQLTELEFLLIKNHSRIGYDILKNIDFSHPIADIVLQHHERINGSGYPNNLKGDDILLEARIIGVADVVEAMISHRPYRPALGLDNALAEITKNKGILYDPEVVDICVKLFKKKGFTFK
jgi:PAS domain S-box-containing protein/putative nucleotidyltransferase with HDIG domain